MFGDWSSRGGEAVGGLEVDALDLLRGLAVGVFHRG